jgi:hypothetical protein
MPYPCIQSPHIQLRIIPASYANISTLSFLWEKKGKEVVVRVYNYTIIKDFEWTEKEL